MELALIDSGATTAEQLKQFADRMENLLNEIDELKSDLKDLKGEAKLAPEFVSKITGGKVSPKGPVPLPMNLGGTLKAPTVGTGSPGELLQDTVKEEVRGRVEEEIRNRARRIIPQWPK